MEKASRSLIQCLPGIWRAELSLRLTRFPFWYLRVNAYVLEAADGLFLLDCGPSRLYPGLRALIGRAFPGRSILRVYLTHGHADHAGAGARCVAEGIEVWGAEAEVDLLRGGGPPGVPGVFRYPPFTPTHILDPDHRITLADGRVLQAIPAPGHTPGSLCFTDEHREVLFHGDALFGPRRRYAVTFTLEILTTLRQPKPERCEQIDTVSRLRDCLAGRNTLMLPGHGTEYRLDGQPGAFDRSERILRRTLRLR